MINVWVSNCLSSSVSFMTQKKILWFIFEMCHIAVNQKKKPHYQVYYWSMKQGVTAWNLVKLCVQLIMKYIGYTWIIPLKNVGDFGILAFLRSHTHTKHKATLTIKLTYLCMIWCLSFGSSSMLTDRSEMETAAEAVSVTSSTRTPSPSSSGSSSLCVCSLLRCVRSTVHLKCTQMHNETDITVVMGKLTELQHRLKVTEDNED